MTSGVQNQFVSGDQVLIWVWGQTMARDAKWGSGLGGDQWRMHEEKQTADFWKFDFSIVKKKVLQSFQNEYKTRRPAFKPTSSLLQRTSNQLGVHEHGNLNKATHLWCVQSLSRSFFHCLNMWLVEFRA